MLSVDLNKKDRRLDLYFDVPIPSFLESNDELETVIKKLRQVADVRLGRTDDNNISCLSVGIHGWIEFVKSVLSEQRFVFQQKVFSELLERECKKLGNGMVINFHQRPFDTQERYWNFILSQGNFAEYFVNRLCWYYYPKYTIVSPFPMHVDLEASSTCNMNCPMCYRDQLKETGQMDIDLFKKAIDECAANEVFSVRLSWRGETLTHPAIKEMISYATNRIKNVSFLTNAFYFNEDNIDCFIENGVSYVAVSFDGIGETYESIRHPAKFSENYNRLAMLQDRKRQSGSMLPQVRLCTLWPAIKENPDAYYQIMKNVSDYIVCNPYINFKGPMKIKSDFICQYPWERIVVAFDGNAQCCTGWNPDDILLGNIRDNSIRDMWHSDLMTKIRKLHTQGRRMELNSCANCRHGSEGDPNINIKDILDRMY